MGEHEPARPAPEPIDAAETKAEIDDSAPDEVDAVVDAVVDALPGGGKLGTSRNDLDDVAGGLMQVP